MRDRVLIATGIFLAATGVGVWVGTGAGLGPLAEPARDIGPSALPAIGIPVGAGIALLALGIWRVVSTNRADASEPGEAMLGITAAGAAVLLVAGVLADKVSPMGAALVLILGMGSLLALHRALREVSKADGLAFESHWGGLAGGMGGWRLSAASVTFLVTIILIGAAIAAALGADPKAGAREPHANSQTNVTAPSAPTLNRAGAAGGVAFGGGDTRGGGASDTVSASPPSAAGPAAIEAGHTNRSR